jgi:hypothetical protein
MFRLKLLMDDLSQNKFEGNGVATQDFISGRDKKVMPKKGRFGGNMNIEYVSFVCRRLSCRLAMELS